MNTMALKEFLISLVVALVLCVLFALVTRSKVRRTGLLKKLFFRLLRAAPSAAAFRGCPTNTAAWN